jgi:phosphate acyltransferase
MRIGVDVMGGDMLPHILFESVVDASLQCGCEDTFVVFATKSIIESSNGFLEGKNVAGAYIEFVEVADVITMDDDPRSAVRQKKDSSLVVGVAKLAERSLDAFVSSGNTGALVVAAHRLLDLLPLCDKPALLVTIPTKTGVPVALLDVGATVSCSPQDLCAFACYGAAFQHICSDVAEPRIGLMNVGKEKGKGTAEMREAYSLLEELAQKNEGTFHFIGNIEGTDVFSGDVDVIVTDGFTGNVLLKTAEATAEFLREGDGKEYHIKYHGGLLCGVDGVVMKCHGSSSRDEFSRGILRARQCAKSDIIKHIRSYHII